MRRRFVMVFILLSCTLCHANVRYGFENPRDAWILGSGLLLNGIGGWFYHQVSPPDPSTLSQSEIFFPDRIALRYDNPTASRFSDWTLILVSMAPLAMSVHENSSTGKWTESALYLESQIWTSGLTRLCKGIVRRPRPYAYAGSSTLPDKDAARSFFSGHTSIAFTGAVSTGIFFDHFYPESKWSKTVWISSLSLAATTGVLRILAGKHFPTDVLTGAIVGSFVGWMIPKMHEEQGGADESSISQAMLLSIQFSF